MPGDMSGSRNFQEGGDQCFFNLFNIGYRKKLFPSQNYPSILVKPPSQIDSISAVDLNLVDILISDGCENTLDYCAFPGEDKARISMTGSDLRVGSFWL